MLVGIFSVRSYQLALRLHNEVPGIVVPETCSAVSSRPARTRAPRASRSRGSCYAEAREKAAGVYVIPPFKQPEAALDLTQVHGPVETGTRAFARSRRTTDAGTP